MTSAPRWNLTSRMFQAPFLTFTGPLRYASLGGSRTRAGISVILSVISMPNEARMGALFCGENPRVGRPSSRRHRELIAGGLHAILIISAVSSDVSFPRRALPGTMSHNSAGTHIASFLLSFSKYPRHTTGNWAAYFNVLLYSNHY